MKAAYLDRPLTIAISSVPKPEPLAGELCVRLTATGICGSDVHLFRGHRPLPGLLLSGMRGLVLLPASAMAWQGGLWVKGLPLNPISPAGHAGIACVEGEYLPG